MFENGNKLSPGRKKGSVNRINIDIRQKFYTVYEDIGKEEKLDGDESFRVWARSNKKTFYSLFCKLAPTNLNINDNRQHESFIDRMAKEMLLKEVEVVEVKAIDIKSQLANQDTNQDNMSSKPMGNDTDIVHGNGGYMGDNDIHKEVNHPIIEGECEEVINTDELKN